jgi:hypothetical protein
MFLQPLSVLVFTPVTSDERQPSNFENRNTGGTVRTSFVVRVEPNFTLMRWTPCRGGLADALDTSV